jgi:hypothetical protein
MRITGLQGKRPEYEPETLTARPQCSVTFCRRQITDEINLQMNAPKSLSYMNETTQMKNIHITHK